MLDVSEANIEGFMDNIGVTPEAFTEEDVIDEAEYNWYLQRFEMFVAENAKEAINVYVHHACIREDLNDITKVAIMQASLSM